MERHHPSDAGVLKIPNRKLFKEFVVPEPEFIRVEFNLEWAPSGVAIERTPSRYHRLSAFLPTSLNGFAGEIRQYDIKMGHGKCSCHWGNCEGLRVAGLDMRAPAVVGVDLSGAPGSTLLSRELVTVLPPPVGGLSRTLSANQIGGREPSGCFGGSARNIGGLANSALIAVSGFVRYGTMRRQGLGHLQLTRKRRHRQTSRLRD